MLEYVSAETIRLARSGSRARFAKLASERLSERDNTDSLVILDHLRSLPPFTTCVHVYFRRICAKGQVTDLRGAPFRVDIRDTRGHFHRLQLYEPLLFRVFFIINQQLVHMRSTSPKHVFSGGKKLRRGSLFRHKSVDSFPRTMALLVVYLTRTIN